MQQFTDEQRKEMLEAAIKRMQSGYGGVDETGAIVDRRFSPDAMPFQENRLLNTPPPIDFELQEFQGFPLTPEQEAIEKESWKTIYNFQNHRLSELYDHFEKTRIEVLKKYLNVLGIEYHLRRFNTKTVNTESNIIEVMLLFDYEPFMTFQLVNIETKAHPIRIEYDINWKFISAKYPNPFPEGITGDEVLNG